MTYDRGSIERKWQDKWEEWKIHQFDPDSDAPVYSIDNPPRYASGVLHMGHATQYTLIDFVARYRRMRGYNVFFPLCFDVNGMPIEVAVERKYGVNRQNTPRQKLVELCREFANANIEEMTRQYKILGESMDPTFYYQTDEEYYRRITQLSFIEMHKRKLVYKKEHPINWCPHCVTALSDADVEYHFRKSKLNYIRFEIEGGGETIIATSRPELLCTCQLVAVHPEDGSKTHLIGKRAKVPLFDKTVDIVGDDAVDPEFGTGVVMICSIGDKEDIEWIYKYGLPMEKGIDEQGKMTALAGKYEGMTVKEARESILRDLKEQGLLVKQEELEQNVGECWRCHTPTEFILTKQWFLNILDFKEEILRIADEIKWFPDFMKVRLRNWTNSLAWDWCLSRQRYFATPIPVWNCTKCDGYVVATEDQPYVDPTIDPPPVDSCPKCGGELKGEEDVFDTWMDSSLTPLFNAHWRREGEEKYFKMLYPMSLRPQSHDIIRNWAFYTILREFLLVNKRPWDHIAITAFILAEDGTPMHTSLGNVIDPLPIVEEHGADAFRYFVSTCALGANRAFRMKEVTHGFKLCTKLWNLLRFVGGVVDEKVSLGKVKLRTPDRWILTVYSKTVEEATSYCEEYRFDRAVRTVEYFVWHQFADHYVEMVKHRRNDKAAKATLYEIGLGILKLLAPFLPHITEELYQNHFKSHEKALSIHVMNWPEPVLIDDEAEEVGCLLRDVISAIRSWKSEKGIPLSAGIGDVTIAGASAARLSGLETDVERTVKASKVTLKEKVRVKERAVSVRPKYDVIGPAFREHSKEIFDAIKKMEPQEASLQIEQGTLLVTLSDGTEALVSEEMVETEKVIMSEGKDVEAIPVQDLVILVET